MRQKLIVFDVDGVLLNTKMGAFKDILIILGKGKEVRKIDEEYQKRRHLGPWGREQIAELYKGFSKKKIEEIATKYCQENLERGAKECIAELKDKGYIVGALSSNPQIIMDFLAKDFSLDFSEGARLGFRRGKATGKFQKKVDRYVKAEILQKKIEGYKIKKENVIVIGESITDLPMAELAGTFIAFRPKEDIVKEKATKIIENFKQLKDELL
jgi:phosphoserine phosphatase